MTEKTLTTENIRPALDALRGELAPWPVVAKKQDRLNTAQLNAANSGITSSLVAQIIANTAAIRALESAITGTGLRALVVASLPAVGTTGILYIVPVTTYDPDTDADVVNYSNEYIWIPVEAGQASEGYYEQVGQTGIVINNGQLTITVNGTSVGTFTANQSGDTTAAITVPTNADYVDRTTDQTVAGVKTFSSTINGTASKAIADEDGTNIKSGYVNVAGNQTVSGQKTWSGNQFFTSSILQKNNNYTLGNTVSANQIATYSFADSVNSALGYCRSVIYETSNMTSTELAARNKFKNGALDPTGSVVSAQFYVRLDPNGNKYIAWDGSVNNSVIPFATNTYSLGSSSYQWSSVYAQTYYYNGVAWGLDKSNVWGNNQTVTGNDKGWNIINPDIEKGVIPNANKSSFVWWSDKNNNFLGRICSRVHTDGTTMLWLSSLNYYKNGALDPTGSSATTSLILGVDANAYKYVQTNADFRPDANNTSNLGTSTNQWKSVYSQTYYYNGTAWGLDQTNNWTGSNIFTGSVILPAFGSNNYKNYGIVTDYGYTQANNYYRFLRTTGIYNTDNTPDTSKPSFLTFRPNRLQTELMDNIQVCNSGTNNYLAPITNNATDLGTSTKKWKTLNGVNPGALSLPDYNSTAKVDISGSIIPDQYNNIYYTPPINGWLYVCFNLSNATTSDSIFYIQAKDNNVANSSFVQTSWMPTSSGTSSLAIFFPVVANKRFIMQINFSNYTIIKAHVIPCLGNV